jgi:hypothetical protein
VTLNPDGITTRTEYPDMCTKCLTEAGIFSQMIFNYKQADHHDDEDYVPDNYDEAFGG